MKKARVLYLVFLFCASTVFAQAQVNFSKSISSYVGNFSGLQPEVKTINIRNGLHLQYAERGDDSGIPVIFLHGYTDSWRSFESVLSFLPECIHAFALSQRGHGNSDRPSDGYHPNDFAADIAAFIEKMDLGPTIIVGHSMGGLIAQRFALNYPQLTKALVIVSSDASFKTNPGMDEFSVVVSNLADPVNPVFVNEFQQSTLARPINSAYYDTLVAESLKLPARVWKAVWRDLLKTDLSEELHKIRKPTLIVWGDQDAFCMREDQDFMTTHIKGSELLVYKNTGHALHWENPARFANDLELFIRRVVTQK